MIVLFSSDMRVCVSAQQLNGLPLAKGQWKVFSIALLYYVYIVYFPRKRNKNRALIPITSFFKEKKKLCQSFESITMIAMVRGHLVL